MKPTRLAFLLLVAACSAAGDAGTRSTGLARYEERRVAMGVGARIVLYADSRERAEDAFRSAFARIETLDAALSDWRPGSELDRLNHAAGGAPSAVSADLFGALERSIAIAKASRGAFDPTVGPLVALWREARASGRPPEKRAIDAVLPLVGWEKVELDRPHRTARLAAAGMRLDLGAIGKGIACDEALAILRSKGCASALVELGGDLAVGEPPPGEKEWKVAAGSHLVAVARKAVSSSGDAAQRLEADGIRYSHVVDPRTGIGITSGLTTTVIADDGATADGLSTAAGVLGPDEGRALVEGSGATLYVDDPRMASLFDGKTLAGWVTKGGRYDGPAIWTIEDGCIVGRVNEKGEGGLIYTEKPYTSFVFECDVRMDYPFDSGVFVRMVPPEQEKKGIQVTLDDRPTGEIAAIYADGFLAHNDVTPGRFWKRDAWNHVKVEVTGFDMHVRAWINGSLAADYTTPPGTEGFAASGLIGLQVHGGMGEPKTSAARFREIRVMELPVFGETKAADGWSPLFDGKTLAGWEEHGTSGGWRVHDGVLGCLFRQGRRRPPDEGGLPRLRSAPRLQDRADGEQRRVPARRARRLEPGVLGLRDPDPRRLRLGEGDEVEARAWQFTGSLYGAVPAGAPGTFAPVGSWNTYEISYRGKRLAVALNGRTLYDVDVEKVPAKPPFAARAQSGFIGLQRHASDGRPARTRSPSGTSIVRRLARPRAAHVQGPRLPPRRGDPPRARRRRRAVADVDARSAPAAAGPSPRRPCTCPSRARSASSPPKAKARALRRSRRRRGRRARGPRSSRSRLRRRPRRRLRRSRAS
jgi:thiamine biosynthesis lipoprotein